MVPKERGQYVVRGDELGPGVYEHHANWVPMFKMNPSSGFKSKTIRIGPKAK